MKIKNEQVLVDKAIIDGEISNKTSETIFALCKYYFKKGMTKKQVRVKIEEFMVRNYKQFNTLFWKDNLDKWVNIVYKKKNYELINIEKVLVSESELNNIKLLNDKKLEYVAFVVLIHSKVGNQINSNDNNWVNSSTNEIYKDTKLPNAKMIQKEKLISKLIDSNLQLFAGSKAVNNISIQVLMKDNNINESGAKLVIKEFNNFIYDYMVWRSEGGLKRCERCGEIFNFDTKNMRYCDECREVAKREKTRNRVQKHRENAI